jgi:hypothetical protein
MLRFEPMVSGGVRTLCCHKLRRVFLQRCQILWSAPRGRRSDTTRFGERSRIDFCEDLGADFEERGNRATSENAKFATFIIPHRNGVSNTLVTSGAFSEGTRSVKKAANWSI